MTNNMKSYTTTQQRKQLRTRELQVLQEHVGIVIGKGGETIKQLAKDAGDGCRIQHDRKRPGLFVITARTSQACLRAEIKIKEKIQSKTSKTHHKPRNTTQKNHTQHHQPLRNSFQALEVKDQLQGASLQPKKEEGDYFKAAKNQKPTIQLGFRDDNSIGKRKFNNWLQHHASEEKKREHAQKQKSFSATPQTHPQASPTNKDFPSFVKERKTHQVGVWGSGLDKVKAEPVEEVEEEEAPSDMVLLVKGQMKKEEAKFEMDLTHLKPRRSKVETYEDPNALCLAVEDEPEPAEFDEDDEDEWEEDDYEDRFADEVDHTLISCA